MATVPAGTPPTNADLTEHVRDAVAAFLVGGDAAETVHDDAGNTLTLHALAAAVPFNANATTLTNMVAGDIEFATAANPRRFRRDLTRATQARLVAHVAVAGAATAKLRAQYSTDQSAWNDLGTAALEASLAAVTVADSGWVNLAAGAKADVYLRLLGSGGDGVADPVLQPVELQFR